jgi:broad specificity phosphatase PhoE
MTHVVVVRHGRAAAGFDADLDPGLDEAGSRQAEQMASALVLFGPLPLYTSPMRRCVETAGALGARWTMQPIVEPGVGEIPSPAGTPLAQRGAWLRGFMSRPWSEQPDDLVQWRDGVVDAVLRIGAEDNAVIVSHFVALNALVSVATGDDRVVCFTPANCSRTEFEVVDGSLRVVELGEQARTLVQ